MATTRTEDIYRLDRNHLGVRLIVMFAMLGSGVVGLFVVMPLITNVLDLTGLPELCVTVIGVLVIGVGLSWGIEAALRELWPSGSYLVADDSRIELRARRAEPSILNWDERINLSTWYFPISRGRSWVPKGWYCVACRLHQDEKIITPYAFFKPEEARKLPEWDTFELLVSQKSAPKRGDEHLLKKFGEQSQLRSAEKERWDSGVEMSARDFVSLMQRIDKNLLGREKEGRA
jgi:hypothetical protein